MSSESCSGLLVLDKPVGVTSYDCVHRVKDVLQAKRVGHCGTLDPLARGVLLILTGAATRQQDTFLGLEKHYWFRAEFGHETTTGDREGERRNTRSWDHVTRQTLEVVLREFTGTIQQTPPAYAALKFKGKPYYAYARAGVDIPRVPRPVTVHSFELLGFSGPFWEARVVCSRGTYIRALVEDVAARLGTAGVLDALIRERVGSYSRAEAIPLDQVNDRQALLKILHPLPSQS